MIHSMKRTQVQIPQPLYDEIKRVARLHDWSITEVLRRGAEYIVACYPKEKGIEPDWAPPTPRRCGAFLAPVENWRMLANEPQPPDPVR